MKYNRSEIMKRAWEIKRMNKANDFGLCLSLAWERYKSFMTQIVYEVIDGAYLVARTSYEGEAYCRRDAYNRTSFGSAKVVERKRYELFAA